MFLETVSLPKCRLIPLYQSAIEKLGVQRFAVMYPRDIYGETFMALFQDKVSAYGKQIVSVESYTPGQTDFGKTIKEIINHPDAINNDGEKAAKEVHPQQEEVVIDVDAIFVPDTFTTVGLIAPQLLFYDIKDVLLLGTNLWHSESLIEMASKYVQGALVPDVFYMDSNKKQVVDFIFQYENAFQEKPKLIDAVAFDTAMMLFQIVSQTEIKSRTELKDHLQDIRNYYGVTGLTSFKTNEEVEKNSTVLELKRINLWRLKAITI